MMRANLLPRGRETFSIFSFEFDFANLREIGIAIVVLIAVATVGIEIEHLRIARLTSAASELESRVAASAPQREESHRLMLDLARYQEFEREAARYRGSGAIAAIRVAQIGNAMPANVWVDEIASADDGYAIAGGARTVDALTSAIAGLGRAQRATLVNIVSRERSGVGVHFTARLMPFVPKTPIR